MIGSLVIVSRFCGPPDSGNGGYVCGLIAGYLDGPAEVTLRKPPPLETPLNLERDGGGSVRVRDGQTLIAEATSSPNGRALQLPDPVSVQQARSAGARSHLRVHPGLHPFPTCFVCGPDRRRRFADLGIRAGPPPRAPAGRRHLLGGPDRGEDRGHTAAVDAASKAAVSRAVESLPD
jgi:hypothetical protein